MTGFDELWPGGPRFRQAEGAFKLSTDSVLLAAFAQGIRGQKAIDLGCGAGVLTVLLSYAGKTVEGVEIQPLSAQASRANMAANGFDPALIREGDLRLFRDFLPAGAYDLVLSNPPYFPQGSGLSSPQAGRAEARDERSCTLGELCAAAKYLCRWGGAFALVHRPERLSEIFCAMTRHGMEPKRLRLVQYSAGRAPSLVLIEGRRGGRPGLTIEKPLLLCREDGSDSDEIRQIYHRG
ncbi:MAG: tRNA1(Val) (adenine(37)-N6)-methyltransferase [Oscillospiraceae bacterium]